MPPEPDFLWPHINWIPYVDTLADAEAIELNATTSGSTHSGNIAGTNACNCISDECLNNLDIALNDINCYDSALEFDYNKQNSVRVASSVMKQLVEEIKKFQERNDFLEAQNEKTLEQIWDKIIN